MDAIKKDEEESSQDRKGLKLKYFENWLRAGGKEGSWGKVEVWEKRYSRDSSSTETVDAWLTLPQLAKVLQSKPLAVKLAKKLVLNPMTWRPHPQLPEELDALQVLATISWTLRRRLEDVRTQGISFEGATCDKEQAQAIAEGLAQKRQSIENDSPSYHSTGTIQSNITAGDFLRHTAAKHSDQTVGLTSHQPIAPPAEDLSNGTSEHLEVLVQQRVEAMLKAREDQATKAATDAKASKKEAAKRKKEEFLATDKGRTLTVFKKLEGVTKNIDLIILDSQRPSLMDQGSLDHFSSKFTQLRTQVATAQQSLDAKLNALIDEAVDWPDQDCTNAIDKLCTQIGGQLKIFNYAKKRAGM